MKVFVDKKFWSLLPRPSKSQRESLKQSIIDNGQLVPIIVNKAGKIIDGHTRFAICQELGIDARVVVKDFVTEDGEKEYAVLTNVKRRHLTAFQISFLIDDIREKWKQEKRIQTNNHISKVKQGLEEPVPKSELMKTQTHMKAAEVCGVKSATMQKIDYIKKHGNDKEINLVKSDQCSVEVMYRRIVNRRHKMNKPNIRNDRVFPDCGACGGRTRFVGRCHVHKSFCCTNCEWGQ